MVSVHSRLPPEVILMSVQPGEDRASETGCWCCGAGFAEAELVRLGQHPEVGVCLRCARWVQRRAVQRHDEQHPSPAALLRGGIQAVRAAAIRNGWHRRGVAGTALRWIDRYLP